MSEKTTDDVKAAIDRLANEKGDYYWTGQAYDEDVPILLRRLEELQESRRLMCLEIEHQDRRAEELEAENSRLRQTPDGLKFATETMHELHDRVKELEKEIPEGGVMELIRFIFWNIAEDIKALPHPDTTPPPA